LKCELNTEMQIVFVTETPHIGGGEVIMTDIAEYMMERGVHTTVLVPENGPLATHLTAKNINVCEVSRPPLFSTSFYYGNNTFPNPFALVISSFLSIIWLFRLYQFFRSTNPSVVHTVSTWSHVVAGLAARLAGYPVIWHYQSIIVSDAGWGSYRWLMKLWARIIPARIICLSKIIASQFQNHPALRNKTDVVWNFVDTSIYRPAIQNESMGKMVIGTVARLTPWKGQDIALRAAKILKEKGIQYTWVFAGDTKLGSEKYRNNLLSMVKQWGLEQNVTFLGYVDNMPEFYRSLDVLVHVPVKPEPFGMVVAEGIASGLPVIASSGGGTECMIKLGGGFLVRSGNAKDIVANLLKLIQFPQNRSSRSRQARYFAENNFSLKIYTDYWLAVYQSVVPS